MGSTTFFLLTLAVFGVSAQSFGFRNLNGGTGMHTSGLESQLHISGHLSPTVVQNTCNCIKTVFRPQVRKEVFSGHCFLQNPLVQKVPFASRNVDMPAFQLPATSGIGLPIADNSYSRMYGGMLSRGGYLGSGFQKMLGNGFTPNMATPFPAMGGGFLGTTSGILGSSFPGAVSGTFSENQAMVLPGAAYQEGGFKSVC